MKTQTPKTPQIRAVEIFALVHGKSEPMETFWKHSKGWLKLGKLLLRLEGKRKKPLPDQKQQTQKP